LLPLHFGTSQLQTLREEENKSTETINRKLNKQAKEKKKLSFRKHDSSCLRIARQQRVMNSIGIMAAIEDS
jgi:hypothetical protein